MNDKHDQTTIDGSMDAKHEQTTIPLHRVEDVQPRVAL
jgi:hypothetical protein